MKRRWRGLVPPGIPCRADKSTPPDRSAASAPPCRGCQQAGRYPLHGSWAPRDDRARLGRTPRRSSSGKTSATCLVAHGYGLLGFAGRIPSGRAPMVQIIGIDVEVSCLPASVRSGLGWHSTAAWRRRPCGAASGWAPPMPRGRRSISSGPQKIAARNDDRPTSTKVS